jgi:hypothetical protein
MRIRVRRPVWQTRAQCQQQGNVRGFRMPERRKGHLPDPGPMRTVRVMILVLYQLSRRFAGLLARHGLAAQRPCINEGHR